MTKRLLVILGLACVAGCGKSRTSSPFADIAKEPLQAGVGLGDLKLMQTTLGAVASKFEKAEPVVTAEPTGTKFDFIKEGLSFLFNGDPACAQGLSEQMTSSPEKRDINGFLLKNPNCETMLLESIAAYIPSTGEPLYEGETIEGVGLNASREMAENAYKATVAAVNALEGGTELPEQPAQSSDEIHYPGIRIYMGKDASGRDVVRKLEIIPRQ